jgi:hypothetical protein
MGRAELRNAYKILFENPEEQRTLGRPTQRCEGNVERDLK